MVQKLFETNLKSAIIRTAIVPAARCLFVCFWYVNYAQGLSQNVYFLFVPTEFDKVVRVCFD